MKSSLSFPDTPNARVFLTGTYKGLSVYLLIIKPVAFNLVIRKGDDNKNGNGADHFLSCVTPPIAHTGAASFYPYPLLSACFLFIFYIIQ